MNLLKNYFPCFVWSWPINFQKLDTAYYIYTLKNTRLKITFSVKFESYIKLEIIENHKDWYFFTVKKSDIYNGIYFDKMFEYFL